MPGFDLNLHPYTCDESDYTSNAYTFLILLAGIAAATYAFARFAESKNRLNYDSRVARIIAGSLVLMTHLLHSREGALEIEDPGKKLIAVGPHRTGWEAIVVASTLKGAPPRYFATDAFNVFPGVSSFMKMFKAITVEAKPTEGAKPPSLGQAGKTDESIQSANNKALEQASKALDEDGCVALFPQGNFSKLGQEPPRIYAGVAKLALMNKIPIHVIRLDGFWCLQNPLIPLFVRNSQAYRAFLSGLHVNNVRPTLCCVIDFHLQPENAELSDEKKIEEISAQLYAYYRHTKELSSPQIEAIKTQITDKTHLLIWKNKVARDDLKKQLTNLQKEGAQLDEATSTSMMTN